MQELTGKRNIEGREEEGCVINSLDASYVLFKKVLQLFMTEVVGLFYNLSFLGLRDITFSMRVNST